MFLRKANEIKKLTALLLAVIMLIGSLSIHVFAQGSENKEAENKEEI